MRIDCRLSILLLSLLCCFASAAAIKSPTREETTSHGLDFLAKRQNPDGWFDGANSKVSTTSRALLAFLSAGGIPDAGKYGLILRDASEWLLTQQASDGYFGAPLHGMRSHALATLALAELYGVDFDSDRRSRIATALEKAAAAIAASQVTSRSQPIFNGGWNVERNSADSTLSVTVSQVLALEACRQNGIRIPGQSLDRAAEFVLRCRNSRTGGFGPAPSRPADAASTAAAIVCLQLLGGPVQHPREFDAACEYLSSAPIDETISFGYASIGVVILSAYKGGEETWAHVGQPLLARLARMQEKDGGWPAQKQSSTLRAMDRSTTTALSIQTLTISYRLLPIYQQ